MKFRLIKIYILLVAGLFLSGTDLIAQDVTKISGKVIDASTKEALPFVNIELLGTYTGTTTDLDGYYSIDTRFPSDSIKASFLGYEDEEKKVIPNIKQEINFELKSTSLNLETVDIIAKKGKYTKKNNPAVDLIKKVMDNKKTNRLEGQDFYSYDQYEKVEVDLNNITDKFMDRKIFNSFKFIWEYVDTSKVNGKPYLPLFLRETSSTVYYRKDPKTEKEHRHAIKTTKFEDSIDDKSINDVIDVLYQDIDIYDNTIMLLSTQFVSPLAPLGVNFYRYYIIDTVNVNGQSAINLAFIPKNKANFGFTGNLFISNDDKYTVLKFNMGIIGGINLNFVRDIAIEQEFIKYEDAYIRTKDKLTVDYSFTKNSLGAFGTRSVVYDNFSFDPAEDESVYGGLEKIVVAEDALKKSDEYWQENRLESLSKNELGVYEMIDSLKNLKAYKKLVYVTKILITGYAGAGPVDIGPLATFVSFNQVEGLRLRYGMETNLKFSKKVFLKGFGTRGFKDDAWKYGLVGRLSFNEDWKMNPKNEVGFEFARETSFPGLQLEFLSEDNFLLSFRRGRADQMLLTDKYKVNYLKEGKALDFGIYLESKKIQPYGALEFNRLVNGEPQAVDEIQTTEIGLDFQFAPNQQFFQGRQYRIPIFNKYPVFKVNYRAGFDNVLGGEYNYHKVFGSVFKRFHWSVFGHSDVELEGGKIWGDLPYILLHLPRANQTYSYQVRSFNMMNFMEFASDEFVSLNIQHYYNGFWFNRIPLLKKLKLREVTTLKIIYGRLSDTNNPNLDANLIQFPVDADGNPTTFTFSGKPYIEGSVGIMNIFKFLRLDLVKRFTYLDHPNIPQFLGIKGVGLRAKIKVEF